MFDLISCFIIIIFSYFASVYAQGASPVIMVVTGYIQSFVLNFIRKLYQKLN